MILVFDLGGPLLAYGLLRSAGMSAVAALVISGVLPALGCLLSLRLRRPLIFRLALELLGPGTRKGRDVTAAWRYPGFQRAFQMITVAWGVGYLAEAAIRVAIVATTSTGIALVCS